MVNTKKSIQTNPELTAEYDGKIYAFDSKSGILKIVDLETSSGDCFHPNEAGANAYADAVVEDVLRLLAP